MAQHRKTDCQPSIVPPPFGSGYPELANLAKRVCNLQLCRPLSGAVIGIGRPLSPTPGYPSIVPPPFGSGYYARPGWDCPGTGPSIVPRVNGQMPVGKIGIATPQVVLQLCRPLSGAVMQPNGRNRNSVQPASIVPPPFGSGYSDCDRRRQAVEQVDASIAPPPFGSGYAPGSAAAPSANFALQLCRPLSGAVMF